MKQTVVRPLGTAVAAAFLTVGMTIACKGGGGSPTTPSPGPSVPTITITASGVSPSVLRINLGQRVRFVNNDARMREPTSNPHLSHRDCPPLNEVGRLATGQSGMTGVLDRAGTCGYHDHLNAEDDRFRGQILIGVTDPGEGPIYSTR